MLFKASSQQIVYFIPTEPFIMIIVVISNIYTTEWFYKWKTGI